MKSDEHYPLKLYPLKFVVLNRRCKARQTAGVNKTCLGRPLISQYFHRRFNANHNFLGVQSNFCFVAYKNSD